METRTLDRVLPSVRLSRAGCLHLVERFTRTEANLIMYRATVEDATAFVKPWTIEMTWVRGGNNDIDDESACHEGN